MWRVLLLVLLAAAPGLAAARWYQVDVVVFKHNVESTTGGEQWPETRELPDYAHSIDLITDLPAMGDEPHDAVADSNTAPLAFKALDRGERGLADLERRLRGSSEYTPLLSAAWRQPNFGVGGAKRVHLSSVTTLKATHSPAAGVDVAAPEAVAKPRIEGIVTLKIARQMAVDVDFVFDHDGTPLRMKASRSMKLREVHYFDHPLFGVLVQVVPYIPPDEDPAAGAGGDEPADEGADSGGGGATDAD